MTTQLSPATLPAYVRDVAPSYGIDPAAALAMAQHEGMVGGQGNPGDGNTSFGPWQLHIGGALPSNIGALGPVAAQTWAWSSDGVDYALKSMANDRYSSAKGLFGQAATTAIAGWERSADIPGQAKRAWDSYAGWIGTNIPIALANFFNVIHPGGQKEPVTPDPNAEPGMLPVPGSGASIPIPIPGQTQTPGQTTTDPHSGGVTNPQDVRLGTIGPFKVGIPSGLVLGLLGLSLLLIGALLFAYGGQFRAKINTVGWSGTRPSDSQRGGYSAGYRQAIREYGPRSYGFKFGPKA